MGEVAKISFSRLLLQWLLGFNFSVAVAVGYIALFGIAVETAVVMIVYLHASLDERLARGQPLTHGDIEAATMEGAVLRLRPVLMTVFAVIGSLGPLLWESGISSDVMKPIAAPIVGGMVSSTLAVMILVPIPALHSFPLRGRGDVALFPGVLCADRRAGRSRRTRSAG